MEKLMSWLFVIVGFVGILCIGIMADHRGPWKVKPCVDAFVVAREGKIYECDSEHEMHVYSYNQCAVWCQCKEK